MAFTSSITGRLGLDSSDYKKGLQTASGSFQEFVRGTAKDAESGGSVTGQKFGRAMERSFGLRHAFLGLFAALGLNMDKIANTIAGAIAGGSKEGWQKAGEIADRESELIEKKIESHLGGARLTAHLQKELGHAMEVKPTGGATGEVVASVAGAVLPAGGAIEGMLRMFGIGRTDAEKLADTEERTVKTLEAEAKLQENLTEERKKQIALAEKQDDIAVSHLKHNEAIDYLLKRYVAVMAEQNQFGKGSVEYEEKRKQLEGIRLKMGEQEAAQLAFEKEQQKEIAALQEQRNEMIRKYQVEAAADDKKAGLIKADLLRLDKAIADAAKDKVLQQQLINEKTKVELGYREQILKAEQSKKTATAALEQAKADRANLALTELAGLGKFAPGVSVETGAQAEQARKALDLQRQAEEKRTVGQRDEAKALFEQADQIRSDLVKSGGIKSNEMPFEQIVKKLEESNKILIELGTIFKGKFVAQ